MKVGGTVLADVKARRSTGVEVHAGKADRTVIGVPNRDDVVTGRRVVSRGLKAARSDRGGRDGETVRVGAETGANAGHLPRRCPT